MRKLIFIFLFTQNLSAAYLLDPLSTQFPDLNTNDLPSSELPDLNTNDLSFLEINSDLNEFNPEQTSSTLQEGNTCFLGLIEQITKNQTLSNKDEHYNTKDQKHVFKCKENNACTFKTNTYSNLKAHCSQKHRDFKFAKPLLCKEEYCVKKRKKPLTYSYKSLAHGEQCPQINDELYRNNARDQKTKREKKNMDPHLKILKPTKKRRKSKKGETE